LQERYEDDSLTHLKFNPDLGLQERYEDDSLTHLKFNLDLWLEAESSCGFNRNQVYDISTL
jgi:hypothetical protein